MTAVFAKLDIGNRGFLDEDAWVQSLQLHAAAPVDSGAALELLRRVAAALERSGQSPGGLFQLFLFLHMHINICIYMAFHL